MTRDAATQRQIAAARPDRSTWLAANAGSGKTKVLTDRVARLLLDGVDPQHILCLTYTKAAASEMQNRLFRRLGKWAMLGDAQLTTELNDLGLDGPLPDEALRNARRLFAMAVETPGGLKIQTIHSFCAGLLRRFPLEAGVSPNFSEMEDRAAALLRAEIVEGIAAGPEADKLAAVARHYSGDSIADLAQEIAGKQSLIQHEWTDAGLRRVLGLRDHQTRDWLRDSVYLGGEQEILATLLPALRAGTSTDQKNAEKLAAINTLDLAALSTLEGVFLSGKGTDPPFAAKIGTRQDFPTKKTTQALGDTAAPLHEWMRRVETARETRVALDALDAAHALHDFAHVFLAAYAEAKQRRSWLDFDDLILKAVNLLTRRDVTAWVLFRLDGGIDHILLDEAQDTSPEQWQVIARLAQEFTSGIGSRPNDRRTIFVVGDKKQSIYSFQGADPREFDRMQAEFAERLGATPDPLQSHRLEHSFRSSQVILDLVDQVFAKVVQPEGLSLDAHHLAFKTDLPGRVDLWPVPEPEQAIDDPAWHDPVDVVAGNDPAVSLAAQIAQSISDMIDTGQPIPTGEGTTMRPVRAGDVLILVQGRSQLFHEIIRACKARNLPIAGADRLRVAGELAVRDLAALLSFLATPEDSLALATALRSPLFGWSETQLHALAQPRTQPYLWPALRLRADEFPETMTILNDLRAQVDYLRPYDLIERILTRHSGRRRLLSRLGPEAEDGIDALLSQALAYEQKAVDSLTGFLVWLETDDLEIKRQMDSAGNRIRVMTVHGAKGLESPIVILPDTGERNTPMRGQITVSDDIPLWRMTADNVPARIRDAVDLAKSAEEAERDRLLYVAMTRAETWLIVACAKPPGKNGKSWYEKIAAGMTASGAFTYSFDDADGLRMETGNWAATETVVEPETIIVTAELSAFFGDPVSEIPSRPTALSPSDLGGAKALPGEAGLDEDAAKRWGRQVHLLLEVLPDVPHDIWPAIVAQMLSTGPDRADATTQAALLSEVENVLTATDLTVLFQPAALVEVPITASLPELGGRRLHGIIDRMILGTDRILIVDFKTNRVVPDSPAACPIGLLRQMGAYAAAVRQIYPGKPVDTALLWTRTAQMMMLPHDLVTEAVTTTSIP
ncbi:double-strand break repair helicase AddA [Roseovarius pelagicus]|uniref:DNA 3'-5' helicase n=1 Tax=Roseovarius pelagicus TaxID=2980108 RepID=A0ABY6D7H3_9RHOB|nr:double-strand break repair helicase AddA [Roseovarius pelagicus]UXX81864.1 double-strand break repair helicase AddA [Roseovarius pelagicus]